MSERAYSDEDDDAGPSVKNEASGRKEKGPINRVNRACNHCRRMKMRCIGAEEPPCKRCRSSGLQCVMEKPGKASGEGVGEDRIRSLESQVSAIQNTLTDLVTTLRAGISAGAGARSSGDSVPTPQPITTTPDYAPSAGSGNMAHGGSTFNFLPGAGSPSGPFDHSAHFRSGSVGSGPTPPFFPGHNPGYLPQQPPSTPIYPGFPPSIAPNNVSNPAGPVFDRKQSSSFGGAGQHAARSGSSTFPPPTPTSADGQFRRPAPPPVPSHSFAWRPPGLPSKSSSITRHESLPPSRAGSVGPDDILGPDEIINPLGAMSNMAGLVEAAVKRAKEEQAGNGAFEGGKKRDPEGTDVNDATGPEKVSKKPRLSPPSDLKPMGPTVVEAQNLPPTSSAKSKAKQRKTHVHAHPDAVAKGYVSEQEGRELMAIFYAGSSNFIPCYDPLVDTWESLRVRSPFSVTTMIMVGARVRDGGGPASDIQRVCREHAQRIAVDTLFHPVQRIEAVQAMALLSAFSESGWLPGGHAVRMAIDMGINRSFVHLLRTGMGKGKTDVELEEERQLVVHSRVWFCLYLVEHQMAYGMGRPAILREDESIHHCRRLLEHPLSITSDARLVSTVELMALRAPLHIELTASPDLPIAENTLRRLKQANTDFDAWERYWDRVLSERFGKGRGDFFRESLIIQRQYAELFVNSQLLRGIREPTDVIDMPEEKRALAIRAMRNAQRCLEICLRGENYRNGLQYAVHYTHVCAAFAASFLIRIARLFPHELNLKKTAKDVEELAGVLSDIPAGRYARSLRLILRRARRAKVIPAASIVSSPQRLAATLPPAGPFNLQTSTPAFSPSQLLNSAFYNTPDPSSSHSAQMIGITPGLPALSPNSTFLQTAAAMVNDSPISGADLVEFDSLFAQETLERAGLRLGEGDQLPLFLDGQSLGGSQVPSDMTSFLGMEQFFIPTELDNMLGGTGSTDQVSGNGVDGLHGDNVWW